MSRMVNETLRRNRHRHKLAALPRKRRHGNVSNWHAPSVFGVANEVHRPYMLNSLDRLRGLFSREKPTQIHLNFSSTNKLHAEGTLLFVAELRRMIRATKGRHSISCTMSPHDKVCQVFEQIGLCRLLGIKTGVTPADSDVVHWRFAHGHKAEGDKYEDILADYDGEIAEPLQEQLYKGITEAMTNVMNHAYDLPREDGIAVSKELEWWMFSQYKDGVLSVTFCDLGAGIPRTLPIKRPAVWKRYLLLGHHRDSAAIEYSVRDSISRTQLDHRGKGLGQICRLIDDIEDGQVTIFSNSGVYLRTRTHSRKYDYRNSILGTMINWKIPLPPKEES